MYKELYLRMREESESKRKKENYREMRNTQRVEKRHREKRTENERLDPQRKKKLVLRERRKLKGT